MIKKKGKSKRKEKEKKTKGRERKRERERERGQTSKQHKMEQDQFFNRQTFIKKFCYENETFASMGGGKLLRKLKVTSLSFFLSLSLTQTHTHTCSP